VKELEDSNANPTPYLEPRGLAGDPRLGITYAWISSASRTWEMQSRMPDGRPMPDAAPCRLPSPGASVNPGGSAEPPAPSAVSPGLP
jgi:hypothetical protein